MNNKNFNSQILTFLMAKTTKILNNFNSNWLSFFNFYNALLNSFNFSLKRWKNLVIKNKHLKDKTFDFDSINHSPLTGNFSGGENSNIYLGDFLKRSSEIIPLLESYSISKDNEKVYYSNFLINISTDPFQLNSSFLNQSCPIDFFKGNNEIIFRFPILRMSFYFEFELKFDDFLPNPESQLLLNFTMKQTLSNQKFDYNQSTLLNYNTSFENSNNFEIIITPISNETKNLKFFIFREIKLNNFLNTLISNNLFKNYSFNDSYKEEIIPSTLSLVSELQNFNNFYANNFSSDSFNISSALLIKNLPLPPTLSLNFKKGYGYSFLIKRSHEAFWGSSENFVDKFFYIIT